MDVRLPRLGEGADSGTVSTIFVKEGDQVRKDQPVLELESEKAVASIPSPVDGKVTKIFVKEGEEIKVGQLILAVDQTDGARQEPAVQKAPAPAEDLTTPPASPGQAEQVEGEATQGVGPQEGEGQTQEMQERGPEMPSIPQPRPGVTSAASPTVRKIARDLGIDLARVQGSERGGRIVNADLRRYIQRLQQIAFQQRPAPARPAPGAGQEPSRPAAQPIDFEKWGSVERKKLSTLRRAISNKMVQSWTSAPHVTQFDEADVTGLMELRKKYAPRYGKKKAHLTLTPFILKAVVETLKKHAIFNASLDEASGEIVYKKHYHFGIAVDTEQGLIVPVIRDIDKKDMLELTVELGELAERTRQRKVALEEMQGGTFTISNQGGIGSRHFTPIINTPEVAILGLGRSFEKPVVKKGKIVKRTMLPVALSYDHRIIDGADAARFMVDLVRAIEEFDEADVKV